IEAVPSPTAVSSGTVASLHRYPVKSMMGEELEVADITERGIVGDRGYALVDNETGRTVSAKNPRKWARMFECRAEYVEPPALGQPLPRCLSSCRTAQGCAATSQQPRLTGRGSEY